MEKPVRGDVVVVPFPFSDLTQAKRRPALVLASLDGDDLILCQITSKATRDRHTLALEAADFEQGSLAMPSNIRPNKLFTADRGIILYKVGRIRPVKLQEAVAKAIDVLSQK